MALREWGYPGCCGGRVINGFMNESYGIPSKRWLEDVDKDMRKFSNRGTGFKTITLTENQKKHFRGIINKYGFKQVSKSNNGSTGRNLYTYILVKRAHLPERVMR